MSDEELDLPWEKPASVYGDDGPAKEVTFEIRGHRMRVAPCSALAPNTLRTRFHVECLSCDVLVHHATTGASRRVKDHLRETGDL